MRITVKHFGVIAIAAFVFQACGDDDAGGGGGAGIGQGGATSGGAANGGNTSGGHSSGGAVCPCLGGAGNGGAPVAGSGGSAAGSGGESAGAGGQVSDEDAAFIPQHVQVSAVPGGRGVFALTALTVRKAENATEAFVTVLNDGDVPACSGSLTLRLFDKGENQLDVGIGALLTRHFFRRTDGSNALAACVAPGDVSVVAITDLIPDLAIEDIRSVVYLTTYFALDVEPLSGGLTIDDVQTVSRGTDIAYTGKFTNNLDVTVYGPTATIYPVNRAGRVLGMATASSDSTELAVGASWSFETNTLPNTPAIEYYAFPTARTSP